MPKLSCSAKRLRIYIGESDRFKGKPLYHAIVEEAKRLDMAGATVVRGIEGYGANSRIHTANILALSGDLPIIVEIVDSEDYINRLMPILDIMVTEGMVIIDDVRVIKYGSKPVKERDN